MDLDAVAGELRAALLTVPGLRVPLWGVKTVQPPAAVVTLPDRITYDETYGRGTDVYPDLPVVLLVGAPEQRASRRTLAQYAAGAGPKSIKAALEAYTYTSCDTVTVPWAEPEPARYAGVDYLGMIFHVHIVGKGA